MDAIYVKANRSWMRITQISKKEMKICTNRDDICIRLNICHALNRHGKRCLVHRIWHRWQNRKKNCGLAVYITMTASGSCRTKAKGAISVSTAQSLHQYIYIINSTSEHTTMKIWYPAPPHYIMWITHYSSGHCVLSKQIDNNHNIINHTVLHSIPCWWYTASRLPL